MRILSDELHAEALDAVEELVDAGADEDKAVRVVAGLLDAALPLDSLIPGPLGKIAEERDGDIFLIIVDEIVDLWDKLKEELKADPTKKAARKAKRAAKQHARRARRKARYATSS